ncbi:MAG TPA: electron transport complex subunit RsxD [Gammaproteobacteria bacterium]|nr:electron transport complex subunit RsxD [Gammaproteobacteria bacterium]
MEFPVASSPHLRGDNDVQRVMGQVLLALLPGIAALWWYFGWGVIVNLGLATATAVLSEWVAVRLRGRDPRPVIADLSGILTAWLLAVAVPPLLPWWQTVLGTFFAIVVAKQLFGGLGYNPFNPAMAGYALLLISFPADMTRWLEPSVLSGHAVSLGEALDAIFRGLPPHPAGWDAVTGATPLDHMRTELSRDHLIGEIRRSPVWGDFGGRGWEWVANWFGLGGLFLLWRGVIGWRIPVAMLGSLLLVAGAFWVIDSDIHPFPAFHLFSGAAVLGAFFIATDPVTAATTPRGQLIYGALIGLLVFVIRTWGGYPDAVAFSVLLMNMAAPTIDHYTQPRVFGEREPKDD